MNTIRSRYVGFTYGEDDRFTKDDFIHLEIIVLNELTLNIETYQDPKTDEINNDILSEYIQNEFGYEPDITDEVVFVIVEYYEKMLINHSRLATKGF